MNPPLSILPGLSLPTTVTSAAADVERAWARLRDAEDAFAMVRHDSLDELFAAQSAWAGAIDAYEEARRAHRAAVRRSRGWWPGLRVVCCVEGSES